MGTTVVVIALDQAGLVKAAERLGRPLASAAAEIAVCSTAESDAALLMARLVAGRMQAAVLKGGAPKQLAALPLLFRAAAPAIPLGWRRKEDGVRTGRSPRDPTASGACQTDRQAACLQTTAAPGPPQILLHVMVGTGASLNL